MVAVTVGFDGTRLSAAQSAADGGVWDKHGSTQSPSQDADFAYQSTVDQGNKVSSTNSPQGVEFEDDAVVDYSTSARVVLAKINVTTFGLIDNTLHPGVVYQIGTGSDSDVYEYYIFGSMKPYLPRGGWFVLAIDPNEPAYRANQIGSPVLTTVDYYGFIAEINASVKTDNVLHDALDWVPHAKGLTLSGGTSSDPIGTFEDFVIEDEDDAENRWGSMITFGKAKIITGMLTIGDSSATEFEDVNQALFWADSYTGAGFNGLTLDLSNAATDILITDCFLTGEGTGFAKDFFHTQTDVDSVNDVIVLDITKAWRDLDYVLYSTEGGSDDINLTDATFYWIRWDPTYSGWGFYNSRDDAATYTNQIVLVDGSGGETHSFTKSPDTRPDLVFTSEAGVAGKLNGCSIDNFRNITLNGIGTLDACKITGAQLLTQDGGTIVGCTISTATTNDGEAFVLADDLDLITDNAFTFSEGHAIRVRPTGAGPFVLALDGNSFSGYGADTSNDAALLIDPVDPTADITINVVNEALPTYREAAGYTGTFVMDQAVTLKITVTDNDDNGVAIENAQTSIHRTDTGAPLMNEDTLASGIASEEFNYPGSEVEVVVRVRKSETTDDPRYFAYSSIQTIDENGLTLSVGLDQNPFV